VGADIGPVSILAVLHVPLVLDLLGKQFDGEAGLVQRIARRIDRNHLETGLRPFSNPVVGKARANADREGLGAHRDGEGLACRPSTRLGHRNTQFGHQRAGGVGQGRQVDGDGRDAVGVGFGKFELLGPRSDGFLGQAEAVALVPGKRLRIAFQRQLGGAGQAGGGRAV